MKLVVRE